jgi:hypothetical protein
MITERQRQTEVSESLVDPPGVVMLHDQSAISLPERAGATTRSRTQFRRDDH